VSHPGFVVFGLRAGVRITRAFDVTVIGENLADTNYRLYGSGVDAPGFNVQVRTRYRF
jgi:outer membrane receptor protein involved in Fe transport